MPKAKEAIAAELAAAGCKAIRDIHCDELSKLLLNYERIVDSLIYATGGDHRGIGHLVITSQRIAHLHEALLTNFWGDCTGKSRFSVNYVLWKNVGRIQILSCSRCDDDNIYVEGYTRNLDYLQLCQFDRRQQDLQGVPPTSPGEVRRFGEKIRESLDRLQQDQATPKIGDAAAEDALIDKLERLARLRESGALDEEEFRVAKRKLLLD